MIVSATAIVTAIVIVRFLTPFLSRAGGEFVGTSSDSISNSNSNSEIVCVCVAWAAGAGSAGSGGVRVKSRDFTR